MENPNLLFPTVVINCISVKDAAYHSGSNIHYLLRVLRSGALKGTEIGQMWLIDMDVLEGYLKQAIGIPDNRYGSK